MTQKRDNSQSPGCCEGHTPGGTQSPPSTVPTEERVHGIAGRFYRKYNLTHKWKMYFYFEKVSVQRTPLSH